MNEADTYEQLWKEYYKSCNHKCDNCPFADECTHYEPTLTGMLD